MKKLISLFVIVLICLSPLVKAEAKKEFGKSQMKQTMLMLGLYLYGLNREADKKNPDYDTVEFLSDSALKYAKELKALKGDERFQKNLDNMILQAETLNKVSTKNHKAVHAQIEAFSNSCDACHSMGSDPYVGMEKK